MEHPFRRNKKEFINNEMVRKLPPCIKSGEKIIEEIDNYGLVPIIQTGSAELNKYIVRFCKCGWKNCVSFGSYHIRSIYSFDII